MADVVLVEDDPDLQCLTELMLTKQGHRVRVFDSARAAIESCIQTPPEVVLMDWMLPEMSGLEALRALREHPLTRSVPVVMVTALDTATHVDAAREAGAQDYVVKPYTRSRLLGAVDQQVSRQRAPISA
jgi:DNA-binding response OmpR family regulator